MTIFLLCVNFISVMTKQIAVHSRFYFCDKPYLCDYDRPFKSVFLFGRVSDLPAVFSSSISCRKQNFLDSLLF